MKLNLGAGNDIREGYINHDLYRHREGLQLAFDLNEKNWIPLLEPEDHSYSLTHISFDEIRAHDVLEHLNDVINFMDNCWDLLKPTGVLDLKVCGYENESFHIDPTHKKGYHIKSFDYFVPGTKLGDEYGYYSKKRWKFIEEPHYDRKGNVLVKLTPMKK